MFRFIVVAFLAGLISSSSLAGDRYLDCRWDSDFRDAADISDLIYLDFRSDVYVTFQSKIPGTNYSTEITFSAGQGLASRFYVSVLNENGEVTEKLELSASRRYYYRQHLLHHNDHDYYCMFVD